MAEETLYCPSCNQKVRVPEEMLGQPVQCPLCRLVFTAPTRGTGPLPASVLGPTTVPWPAASEQPRTTRLMLMAPGIALLLVGLLGMVLNLFRAGSVFVGGLEGVEATVQQIQDLAQQFSPGGENPLAQLSPQTLYRLFLLEFAVFLFIDLLMALAGLQMLRGRSYPLAVLGSTLALLNFFDCICCALSFPIGAWALIVLLQPDTRSSFR